MLLTLLLLVLQHLAGQDLDVLIYQLLHAFLNLEQVVFIVDFSALIELRSLPVNFVNLPIVSLLLLVVSAVRYGLP